MELTQKKIFNDTNIVIDVDDSTQAKAGRRYTKREGSQGPQIF